MERNPPTRQRRSIRYPGYDYAAPGFYFVTLCTQDRACLFGQVQQNEVLLTDAGVRGAYWWRELETHFTCIELDAWVIMPNHLHGIVRILERDTRASLGSAIQWYKTMTTNEYIREVEAHRWEPFPGRLWQRNYYERVVRNETELNTIRHYICENPSRWADDPDRR